MGVRNSTALLITLLELGCISTVTGGPGGNGTTSGSGGSSTATGGSSAATGGSSAGTSTGASASSGSVSGSGGQSSSGSGNSGAGTTGAAWAIASFSGSVAPAVQLQRHLPAQICRQPIGGRALPVPGNRRGALLSGHGLLQWEVRSRARQSAESLCQAGPGDPCRLNLDCQTNCVDGGCDVCSTPGNPCQPAGLSCCGGETCAGRRGRKQLVLRPRWVSVRRRCRLLLAGLRRRRLRLRGQRTRAMLQRSELLRRSVLPAPVRDGSGVSPAASTTEAPASPTANAAQATAAVRDAAAPVRDRLHPERQLLLLHRPVRRRRDVLVGL